MADLIDLKELQEEVVLMAVSTRGEDHIETFLNELKELAATARAVTIARITQNQERVHPGAYPGKGKIDEVRNLIWEPDTAGTVCDGELSPAQLKNSEDTLNTKVVDRVMVTLDIFTVRTNTREGEIQMEPAQSEYRAARLIGTRDSLSHLGGGIGTRRPGEEKLETDRCLTHQRTGQLKEELEDVKWHREMTRQQREENFVLTAAIVGYTSAGKSTLLNRLTGVGILAEGKLFATLDPTTRSLYLEDRQQIFLTDTAGFIRRFPHHLIEAFKSTLEEAYYSDIILHTVDCANPQVDTQMHVAKETLWELETVNKTVVTMPSEVNRFREVESEGQPLQQVPGDFSSDCQVGTLAKTGEGLDEPGKVFLTIIRSGRVLLERVCAYSQTGRIQAIRKYGQLLEEKYRDGGIAVKVYVPAEFFTRFYSD